MSETKIHWTTRRVNELEKQRDEVNLRVGRVLVRAVEQGGFFGVEDARILANCGFEGFDIAVRFGCSARTSGSARFICQVIAERMAENDAEYVRDCFVPCLHHDMLKGIIAAAREK